MKRPVLVVRRSTERPEVLGTFAELVAPGPAIGARGRGWAADLDACHARLADHADAVRRRPRRRADRGRDRRRLPTHSLIAARSAYASPASARRRTNPQHSSPDRTARRAPSRPDAGNAAARARGRALLHLRHPRRRARRRRRGLRVPDVAGQLPHRALRPLRRRLPRPAPGARRARRASTRTTTTRSTFTEDSFGFVYRVRRRLEARRLLAAAGALPADAADPRRRVRRRLPPRPAARLRRPGLAARGRRPRPAAPSDAAAARGLAVHRGSIEELDLEPEPLRLRAPDPDDRARRRSGRGARARSVGCCGPGGRVLVVTDNTGSLDFRDRQAPPLGRLPLPPPLVPVRRAVAAPPRHAHRLRGRRARHDGQPGQLGVLVAQRARRLGRARGRSSTGSRSSRPSRSPRSPRSTGCTNSRAAARSLRAVLRRARRARVVSTRRTPRSPTRPSSSSAAASPGSPRPASCCATGSTSCSTRPATRSAAWPTATTTRAASPSTPARTSSPTGSRPRPGVADQCRDVERYGETVWLGGRSHDYPSGLLRVPRFLRSAIVETRRRHLDAPVSGGRLVPPRVRRARSPTRSPSRSSRRGPARPADELSPAVADKIPGSIAATVGLTLAARLTHRAVAIGYCREAPQSANVWHVYPERGVATVCEQLGRRTSPTRCGSSSPVERIIVERRPRRRRPRRRARGPGRRGDQHRADQRAAPARRRHRRARAVPAVPLPADGLREPAVPRPRACSRAP